MAVPYTFATATTSIPLSQLDSNFATAITLGNTAVYLGNTTTTLGNVTLTGASFTNPTITNYVETLYSATGNTTVALTNGTIQKITTSGATTVTLPSSVSGKSFTLIIAYAAADALTFAGGSTLKWAGGTTPTPTSATGKFDIFSFFQDGTNTYGVTNGQNY
jgi:hypothetical protein